MAIQMDNSIFKTICTQVAVQICGKERSVYKGVKDCEEDKEADRRRE